MTNTENKQWLIDGNPAGRKVAESDFKKVNVPLQKLTEGQVMIEVEYLEFTPSLKGQMENRLAYASKTEKGQVMRGRGIGRVIETRSPDFETGMTVHGYLGWQTHSVMESQDLTVLPDDDLARLHLGPLGSTGMAAYFGFFDAGKPKSGDHVLISGAAGAVGSMVGQMAKISGCKVVGVAGGTQKCDHLIKGLGLDGAIDYKSEDLKAAMKQQAPNGFDIIFDNVGGPFLDAALANMAVGARVVICGAISRYETDNPPPGPKNYFQLVHKRANMRGILSPDYKERFPEARAQIGSWIAEDKFRYFEDIQEGFENIPSTFMRLFSGKNLGKQLLKI